MGSETGMVLREELHSAKSSMKLKLLLLMKLQ